MKRKPAPLRLVRQPSDMSANEQSIPEVDTDKAIAALRDLGVFVGEAPRPNAIRFFERTTSYAPGKGSIVVYPIDKGHGHPSRFSPHDLRAILGRFSIDVGAFLAALANY
jgi:hypothetical protein